jgi:hypothetical protein
VPRSAVTTQSVNDIKALQRDFRALPAGRPPLTPHHRDQATAETPPPTRARHHPRHPVQGTTVAWDGLPRMPAHAQSERSDSGRVHGPHVAIVAHAWHYHAMARVRVSTTVDGQLLAEARSRRRGASDSVLLDEALRALLARHRAGEIDAAYRAYDEHPLDEPDEWGDLRSFREAAAQS